MTLIRINLRDAQEVPLKGKVSFAPTARLHIEEGGQDYMVLPKPFIAVLVDGAVEVELRPNEGWWAWSIIERVPAGSRRWVTVPDSPTPLDYGDLVDVDPHSLDLDADPEPAWWLALEDAVDEESIAAAVEEYLLTNPAGDTGVEYVQSSPLATWTIDHGLGRRPGVAVYIAGVEVEADVTASPTQVTIGFPSPQSGSAVLS